MPVGYIYLVYLFFCENARGLLLFCLPVGYVYFVRMFAQQ